MRRARLLQRGRNARENFAWRGRGPSIAEAMTLAELNACDRDRFVAALGWVFEHSPWVAARAWERRPFATADELLNAMTAALDAARPDERMALLRAHPDLGTRPSQAQVSEASAGEQAGAGFDRLTPAELERLQQLNARYRRRFGFPFLYAVKGSSSHQVLEALETRLSAAAEEELAEALRQVCRIARFRLQAAISSSRTEEG